MNRMKRILALTICLLLTITSLPVTQLVFAEATANEVSALNTEETGVVSVSKSFNYDTVKAAKSDGWSVGTTKNSEFVIKDNFPALNQIQQTVTTNNTSATTGHGTSITYKLPAGPVATDAANRTAIINEDGKYHGIVKIDIDGVFDVGPTKSYDYTHTYTVKEDGVDVEKTTTIAVSVSYANVNIKGDTTAVRWRMNPNNTQALSSDSSSSNTIKTANGKASLGGKPNEGILISTIIDTEEETVTAAIPEVNDVTSSGKTWAGASGSDLQYIDSVQVTQMIRLPLDAYSMLKGIKVTTLDPKFGSETSAILGQLPEKLAVDDIDAVTTAEFTLPEIEGVVWTSSDEELISIDGNKATVNRVKGEIKEVSLKASFKTDSINYSKEYSMTLAEGDNAVKFYDINGNLYKKSEVKNGEKASEVSAPAVEHYNFIGWFEQGAESAFDFDTAINDNVNLYAKYEVNTYNVIFEADGNTVKTLSGKYNDVVVGEIPEVPYKQGYTAIGWYVGDSDVEFDESTLITGPDMVIKAKYMEGEIVSYNVVFKVDGETYHTDAVIEENTVEMPENPTKANYTFDCWTLDGVKYDFVTPVTADIVLEAKFKPNPVTVKFYMDEAMEELHTTGTALYGDPYGKLPVPEKKSYRCIGWKFKDGTDFTKDTIVTEEVSVYAVWESTLKVILDEDITKYTSRTKGLVTFNNTNNPLVKSYYDNGFVTKVVNSDSSDRTNTKVLEASFKVPFGEYDERNRTQVYSKKLVGDYEVIITLDTKLTGAYKTEDGVQVNAPFGYFSTGFFVGTAFKPILKNRLYDTRIQSMNSDSVSTNSFNNLTGDGKIGKSTSFKFTNVADGVAKDNEISIRYDTVKNYAELTLNGREDYAWGTPSEKSSYINGFYSTLMKVFKNDDYIKIKNVKVIQHNDYSDSPEYADAMALLASLPESLVDDPTDVKADITIPVVRGVKWSSSNEDVISVKTGAVSPWFSDEEVIITATVETDFYSFEKEYRLTVKALDDVEREVLIDDTFKTDADLENWTFVNTEDTMIGSYKANENGLEILKATDVLYPEVKHELKKYFAFYDLYNVVDSDANSVTEVKDHKGVYDLTIDFEKYSTSSVPMNIALGYRNGNKFYDVGMLRMSNEGTVLVYQDTAETIKTVDVEMENAAKLTFRIDNINNELSLFEDGKLISERYKFSSLLGEDTRINAVKVELDSNNNIGDSITIKGIELVKLVKHNFGKLESIQNAAMNLDVYDITATPDSVSGSIKNLTETIDGYTVNWSVSNNQIDLESGEVFNGETAEKVYVYAEIYDGNEAYPLVVRKTFELTVRAASNDDELGKFIINNLGRITNQNYSDIRYDLNLPEAESVEWISSDTSIIGNDGKLNAEKIITVPTSVTFTAKSNGVTKDFKLVVSPRTPLDVISSGTNDISFSINGNDNLKLSGDVVTTINYVANGENGKVNVCDDKGRILVSLVAENDGFYFDYLGSDFKKYNNQTAKIDIITMADVDKAAILVDGKIVSDYVSLKADADYVASVKSEINTGTINISADKYTVLQANIDNIDYFGDVKFGYADSRGFDLEDKVITDATLKWTSSNTDILKNNGSVVVPKAMTNVNLHFDLTDNSNSNIFIKKDFTIAVDCDKSKNMVLGIEPSVTFRDAEYLPKNLTDGSNNTIFNATMKSNKDFDIIFNLGAEKNFNSIFVLLDDAVMDGYEIYASDNADSWKLIKSGSLKGELSKLITTENTKATYIKFTVKDCGAKEVAFKELKVFLSATDVEFAKMDLEAISIDAAPTGSTISLPSVGINGTEFTWESSDEKVISNDGKITRPSSATTVKLTVKAIVDGQELSKTFDVYVDTKSTSGPSQVGGGSGGSGGGGAGGMASGGAASTPVIGVSEEDTTYTEDLKPIEPSTSVYNDVKETDWYYDAVKTLTSKGIVSGDGTGYFYPTNNVTREEFVKMILEAIEVEVTSGAHSFGDVESGAWYEDYIATAVSNGIVNGVGGGNFGVGTNITRQDMAVLIERVLAYKNIEVAKEDVEPFADTAEVADYAKEAVANMKAIGLIQGYNNNYNPKDNLTRAEAATVIASLLELLSK